MLTNLNLNEDINGTFATVHATQKSLRKSSFEREISKRALKRQGWLVFMIGNANK